MRLVVLTGAGVSAESGLPTFRDSDGLWHGHRVEEVATPEAYAADPALVHAFYDARRASLEAAAPNEAHRALARLGEALGDDLTLVTQNVDDLHERAGSPAVVHLHGELRSALCADCAWRGHWSRGLGDQPACPHCGEASLRPDVVWFGEVPHHMPEVEEALWAADVFAAIGTSGAVYPAAGFVQVARAAGARTVELTLAPGEGTVHFHDARHGPATEVVPAWVDEVLARQ